MSHARALVERAAENALALAGQELTAPVAIQALAEALHLEVVDLPIEQAGRLYIDGAAAQVVLNSDEPCARRRFTFAHEAAHWLLHGPILDRDLRTRLRRAYGSEEYLCDKLAGALLLPRDWVMLFSDEPVNLSTLQTIASQAQVSLSATLVRLRDVLGWRLTLYQWVKEGSRWVVVGEAGLLPGQQGLLRTTEATEIELSRLSSCEAGRGGLGVGLGTDDVHLPGEVVVNPVTRRALALLQLPDDRRRSRLSSGRLRGAREIAWTIS